MNKKIKIAIASVVLVLIFLIVVRLVSPRQMDDVTPSRLCDGELLDKSSVLMVIPLRINQSIADNQTWCEQIRELNKTIGMHGVYHTDYEFRDARDENYIRIGMEEFNKCFGFYPNIFDAPQLSLSEENEKMLKEMNFTIVKSRHYITHKLYHCTDYGKKSWLVKLNYLNRIV